MKALFVAVFLIVFGMAVVAWIGFQSGVPDKRDEVIEIQREALAAQGRAIESLKKLVDAQRNFIAQQRKSIAICDGGTT